jgi:hypothetical protein
MKIRLANPRFNSTVSKHRILKYFSDLNIPVKPIMIPDSGQNMGIRIDVWAVSKLSILP